MKYVLVLLALVATLVPARAQVRQGPVLQQPRGWVNPLPVDSATGKVSYRAVVQAPGVPEAELYKRAKEWFAEAPSTTKTPLLTDDPAAGRLVGQTGELVRQNFFGANVQVPLWRTITIEVKPGRFRYQITDFAFDSGKGRGAVTPIENYLTPNILTFDANGYPLPVLQSTIEAIQRSGRQQASALRQRVSGKSQDDNW